MRGEGWRVKGLGRGLCACHAYHAYTTVTHLHAGLEHEVGDGADVGLVGDLLHRGREG